MHNRLTWRKAVKTSGETDIAPAGQTTEKAAPAQQEDPNKFQKKYPTPKKLREIKERGLIIY